MEINNLSNMTSSMASASKLGDSTAMYAEKKANDIESENAVKLVESAASAGNGSNNPSHLGHNVDVRA